ncbi:hypothetical protein FJ444_16920 [Aestuariibacter sp. GS-14]|uniref:hypothetical protein n=1 Tax=Aestuariibacter sp. GS-14 TaxID=2590670 RepID=UPI00112CFE3D|nr:hypothetical protein [Aestuariibacter sp. GS-14]TPV55384.1 hypothetical protein FJ444_16920 [Aestuariibacter sp. GS-14]
MTDTTAPLAIDADTLPAIKPRRPFLLEFLLHFCTFGIYTCFWCVTATNDLKRAFNKDFKPWAWFLVPIVFIAQLIMLPRLLNAIDEAEQSHNLRSWSEWKERSWLLFACGSGLFFAVSRRVEIHIGWVLLVLVIWSVCFALLNARMDVLRDEAVNPKRRYYAGYAWWHWPLVVVGVPFVLYIGYSMVISPYLAKVAPLATNTVISDEKHAIELTVVEADWHKVEIGTFSDGSGLFEIAGPLDFQYFIAFEHDDDYTLSDLTQWRIGQNYDDFTVKECSENRIFSPGSLNVEAFVVCKGTSMGDPTIATHHFIRVDNQIFELYGYMSAAKLTYKDQEAGFLRQAQGLVRYEK